MFHGGWLPVLLAMPIGTGLAAVALGIVLV